MFNIKLQEKIVKYIDNNDDYKELDIDGCVYIISNGIDNYIGATIKPRKRYQTHMISSKSKAKKIIETCNDPFDIKNNMKILWKGPVEMLADKEQFYIKKFDCVNSVNSPRYCASMIKNKPSKNCWDLDTRINKTLFH